jgi:hypothetical protein
MKESFPSKSESPEQAYKKRYEAKPGARPRVFTLPDGEEGESEDSLFPFPPVDVEITQEALEELLADPSYTEFELKDLKLRDRLVRLQDDPDLYGTYEVAYCMRTEGDTNRIDRMIEAIDLDDPWQPGRLEHLLLLGKTHPELFDGTVVALGSEIKQRGEVPLLEPGGERLRYSTHPKAAGFNNEIRFLIFRRKA